MKSRKKPKLKAVDFFCCAGGVTTGLKMAGINVLGGIDIDGSYKNTYEKNNPGSKFIQADIAKLSPRSLHKRLGITKNMTDLIFVGCSPCQYYSNIQTDKSKSEKTRLLLEDFKRFVDYYNPAYIFIENVPGLDTKSGSPLSIFKEFLRTRNPSYVFDDAIINAADYRVPQNRKRYILIATRLTNSIRIPKGNSSNIKTVRQAIEKLKPIPHSFKDTSSHKHWTASLHPLNLKRIQKTKHDGGTRLDWKDDPELQLTCYKGKDDTFPDVYGRLFWDKPSPTITTKFHSISNGRFGHPEQDRALSLREGAILQTFPKSYEFFADSLAVIARMIGNAVPPVLAKSIGYSLIKCHKYIDNGNRERKKV